MTEPLSSKKAIEEGLASYLRSPRSLDGEHHELAYEYRLTRSEKPLRRLDIEKETEDYLRANFDRFVPILLGGRVNLIPFIDKWGITNEYIGLLGDNYEIREVGGQRKLYYSDAASRAGYPSHDYEVNEVIVSPGELIALAYARENIRVDFPGETSLDPEEPPYRYFLRTRNRYLCENDYGIRRFDEDKGKVVDGDLANADSFVKSIKHEVERIRHNLVEYSEPIARQLRVDLYDETVARAKTDYLYAEESDLFEEDVKKRTADLISSTLNTLTGDRELILTGIASEKITKQIQFKAEAIAGRYGFLSDDPVADYQSFSAKAHRLRSIFETQLPDTRGGTTLEYLQSEFYGKPIIVKEFDIDMFLETAADCVHSVLARRVIELEDEEVKVMFNEWKCTRSRRSGFFYDDYTLYDHIKKLGIEKAKAIFGKDDRDNSAAITGLSILEAIGYNATTMDNVELLKQVHEAEKLDSSKIWDYYRQRYRDEVRLAKSDIRGAAPDLHWLGLVDAGEARNMFREGKRMYWVAQQVFMADPAKTEESRFYQEAGRTDWGKYDIAGSELPDSVLAANLRNYRSLFVELLRHDFDQSGKVPKSNLNIRLLIDAIGTGQDISSVIMARDKRRYLEGIISGNFQANLEFAIADWPEEFLKAVSPEELTLFFQHAGDFLQGDINSLHTYARWRAEGVGKDFGELFSTKPKNRSDIDFRMCMAYQPADVLEWYREAATYIDSETIQKYLMRFNSIRDESSGYKNLHDVLFWVNDIKRLKPGEAKSILLGIDTMDENSEFVNYISRYHEDLDKLISSGPIQSLRELKKRVIAIESKIDLSTLPLEVVDIVSAPGFDMGALHKLRAEPRFQDLIDGKLDKVQPFQPYKRIYGDRPLPDAIKEGLGSRRLKISGSAEDPNRLFHELSMLVKGKEFEGHAMQVSDLLTSVPPGLEAEVTKLLYEQRVDIGVVLTAEVHSKSDPRGWVAGNYTDCCMPFGSGYNTNYMFSPATQYFTISRQGRIIAQSVIVDGTGPGGSSQVLLDNIEIAKNYKGHSAAIDRVYRTFWADYTNKPVKIGTGNSDLIVSTATFEANNFTPNAELLWSDGKGPQIYNLPKERSVEPTSTVVNFSNPDTGDARLIADMEAESYPGEMVLGEAHIRSILARQRELQMPGAASSFIINKGGKPAGYTLVLPEESRHNPGERVAHIMDMAVLPEFRGTLLAQRMMKRIIEVSKSYGVAIEAEARASTSYAMLMNARVRRWFESQGYFLTVNEKLPGYLGGEDFYFVRFEYRPDGTVGDA